MSSRPEPAAVPKAGRVWPAALVIAAAALLVYINSIAAPFVFDDLPTVRDNASIRSWAMAFSPPPGAGSAANRPLINFSFALNHALGGHNPAGYHVVNMLIHAGAALALFGFVRRTLLLPRWRERWATAALPVAFISALLWAVHPLLTESVTCIAQRTESFAGLWMLLMFYCQARSEDSSAPRRWQAGAFLACLAGVFTKEVMVAGPVLAGFYQVLLVEGSWRAACARRGRFFALLALTWVPLAALVTWHGPRFGAGPGEGIGVWDYALTQCRAILLYLKLSFWPHPLVMDYGTGVNRSLGEVWPQALLLAGLLAATTFATIRKLPAAFAGLWFFAILAPSSSFVPLFTQTIAEHRMYLPLAAVIVLVVAGVQMAAGRRGLFALAGLALPLAWLTVQRNADYRSAFAIWEDTVAKAPDNPRAHTNLANLLDEAGRSEDALREFRAAIRIQPDYALAHNNLTQMLVRQGRIGEAMAEYTGLVQRDPRSAAARLNLGNLLALQERWAEAEAEFRAVIQLQPGDPVAYGNLGSVLFNQNRVADAVTAFEQALAKTDGPGLRFNLGVALLACERPLAALEHFEAAIRFDSTSAEFRYWTAVALMQSGRRPEAIARAHEALRLDPNHANARQLLDEAGKSP